MFEAPTMAKDITSKPLQEEQERDFEDVTRAVFVDTDLHTHIVIPVSSLFTVLNLKREICLEHFKFFPEYGRITVKSVLVKFHENFYHLPDSMLLKTVFHGMGETWFVFADVWTPAVSQNHFGMSQVEPSLKMYGDFKCIEPSSLPHNESQRVTPPLELHKLQDMSCKGKKKKKKKKQNEKKNREKISNDLSMIEFQNRAAVSLKNVPCTLQKQQLEEKTRGFDKWHVHTMGEVNDFKRRNKPSKGRHDNYMVPPSSVLSRDEKSSVNKLSCPITEDHLNKPSEGHHHSSIVQPSQKLLEDGVNVVKSLEGGGDNTNVAETLHKEYENDDTGLLIRAQVTRKRKKSDAPDVPPSHAVTALQDPDIPELLYQPDSLNIQKDIEEDSAFTVSGKTSKKRKTNETKQKRQRNDEEVSPLHLNNATDLLSSRQEPLNLFDKEKEIEEDVVPLKSGDTAKNRKNNKAKNSGIKNQGLSTERQNDDQNTKWKYINRPEESLETMSSILNETRNRGDVPEKNPPVSPVKEQLDEENSRMGPPMTGVQGDKRRKRSRKKQLVPVLDPSSAPVNQQLDKTTEETNASEEVEQADFKTNYDSLNVVERDKELKEDVVPSKSENTTKKNKKIKAKSSGADTQDLSCQIKNDDQTENNGRDSHGECLFQDAINKLEESVETISGKSKKSHIKKALLAKVPPESLVEKQPNEEVCEMTAPISVIQSDKPKKKNTAKKRKTNDSEVESEKTAEEVSVPNLNNVPKLLSQHEPLTLVERIQENKEDITLKCERTAKRSKSSKAKSSVAEIQELSGKGQNDDLSADYIDRPEESVETMNGKLKKSSKFRKDVLQRDKPSSPMKEQSDEEMRELVGPISVKQSDKPKKRNQMKQSVPEKDLRSVNLHVDEASPKRVEQADDFLTNCDKDNNQNIVMQDKGHQDELGENYPQEVASDFADFKHLEKPRASKHKTKKLDQASSIDTSSKGHKLVESKKARDSAKTNLHQKLLTEDDHNKSIPPPMDPLFTQADPINNKKSDAFRESVVEAIKVPGANFAEETNFSKRVDQADDFSLDSVRSDGQNGKEMPQGEDDNVQFSHDPHLEVSPTLPEARLLKKPRTSKEKTKKLDPPSSVDVSLHEHHSVGSKKSRGSAKTSVLEESIIDQKHDKYMPHSGAKHSTILKEVMDTRNPLADPSKTRRKNAVSSRSVDDRNESSEASSSSSGSAVRKMGKKEKTKKPPKKMEAINTTPRRSSRLIEKETVDTLARKKGLLASSESIFEDGSSSSSDDDDRNDERTNASSLSTTIVPGNSSSSDYSEGESKGVGESKLDSPNGNGRSKINSSGLNLESILRSSSRYKKAKLVASQSQDESQPLEFVPDSQADM